jgi:hypothetical protein
MSRDAKKKKVRADEAQPLGWFEKLKRLRLRFRRKDGNVHLLLEDPAEHLASIKRQTAADTSEAALLRAALKSVLDKHASTRSVLVHLSVLEKALGRHGLQALDELPPDVLQRAMTQLETLVSDWSQGNLAGLRARLTEALIKHGRAKDRRRTSERLSDFQNSRQLVVNEASVTTFMEVNAQWEKSLTGQKLSAPPR